MTRFRVNQEVEVRAHRNHPWRAGRITAVGSTDYTVRLDAPVRNSVFYGRTRRLGGDGDITTVRVAKAADSLAEGDHIRARA